MKPTQMRGVISLTLLLRAVFAAPPTEMPFSTIYLFSADLALGTATAQVVASCGVRVIEPIVNGTVTGPAINATIASGTALPLLYSNGTIQQPIIELYGKTDDDVAFYIHEEGIGVPSAQMTRIVRKSFSYFESPS